MRISCAEPRVAAVLLALALAACGREPPPAGAPAADGPPAQPPQVAVVTLETEPVTLTRELPGRAAPFAIAEVRPQVSGIVVQRLFTEGGSVTQGQPLYQLDDAPYRAEARSAQAALARAAAAVRASETRTARIARLATTGAVSAQDRENAQAELEQARADVGVARAALENARVTLGRARIVAPIAGRIGKSSVTPGALVTANQAEPLATIQQLDPMYVDVTQSSAEFLALRRELAAGTIDPAARVPVTIVLEDGTQHDAPGRLAFTEPTVDPATGSYLLRIEVPNETGLLLPGMFVRAIVALGRRGEGLLVPQQAIARTPKGEATALVVDATGTVQPRTVQVSRTIGDRWLVEAGLVAGDRVIVEGLQKARPGAKVAAVERAPDPARDGVAQTPDEG